MKLYTEEEIKRLLKEQIIFDDEDFDKLTPIELPTDKEIHDECKIGGMDTNQQLCFQLGAKWMRDKINNL